MLNRIRHRARSWRRYRQVLAELEFYTDRELADFGFVRCDLPRIAREAVKDKG
jgi:uncharacterized protein YjiS (DUF1127 family)